MAIIPSSSSSLQLSNPFPLAPSSSSSSKPHFPKPLLSFITRATDSDTPSSSKPSDPPQPEPESGDAFEDRLSRIRVRYRSGTGKKAELRKSRKGKKSSGSSESGGMYLPPVPLKEPVSGKLKVDFGFSPYSERVNGWAATVGLSALVLVELASGKSVISYHSPSIVLVQIYFVAAVAALYIKYEKERVSVWPK